ncbi:ImmA/IrrE family metallo-endopeptidase [Acholeplasma sp. OttesenSCG-928-E16]|nr:ImmA/IrrE family metallo-endopeptidase [Acholeplasma sp. OttesenSCG-928-E16]
MNIKYYNFEEYLKEKHLDIFKNWFMTNITHNVENWKLTTDEVYDPTTYNLKEDITISEAKYYFGIGSTLSFDIYVSFSVSMIQEFSDLDYSKQFTTSRTFTFSLECELENGVQNLRIINVRRGRFERDSLARTTEVRLSDELVPIMTSEQVDYFAEIFLMEYYPDALFDEVSVPVVDIIKNSMRLEFYDSKLKTNIHGATFFEVTKGKIYNGDNELIDKTINEGTIIINRDVIENIGMYNNTAIHEAIHWFLHRKYFEMKKLLAPDDMKLVLSCNINEIDMPINNSSKNAKKWMEWQANRIAPHILMPTKTAYNVIQNIYDTIREEYPECRDASIMEKTIEAVSDFYGVSYSVAKIRAVELGFEQARGVYNYVDSIRIKPYSFPQGSLKANETYQISFSSFLNLLSGNVELAKLYIENKIIYCDGFVVKNSEQVRPFLQGNCLDETILNDVSKHCFKFISKRSVNTPADWINCLNFLCRTQGCNLEENICDLSDPKNQDIYETALAEISSDEEGILKSEKLSKDYAEFSSTLPASFGGTLKAHMDRRGYTEEKLEEQSWVSVRSISTYINDPNACPEIETVLALCIGLNLTLMFSLDLIKKAERNTSNLLRSVNYIHMELLTHYDDKNIVYWNLRLGKTKMKLIPSNAVAKKNMDF